MWSSDIFTSQTDLSVTRLTILDCSKWPTCWRARQEATFFPLTIFSVLFVNGSRLRLSGTHLLSPHSFLDVPRPLQPLSDHQLLNCWHFCLFRSVCLSSSSSSHDEPLLLTCHFCIAPLLSCCCQLAFIFLWKSGSVMQMMKISVLPAKKCASSSSSPSPG